MGDNKEEKAPIITEDTTEIRADDKNASAGVPINETVTDKAPESDVEKAEKSIEQIKAEFENKIKELEDRYLRLAAEFDNYKKRNARLYESMVQSVREDLIFPILEVVDNFERALDSSNGAELESFREGTRLIYQQLNDLLKKEGVEIIKSIGEEFNPNLHEAVMQVESDEYPEGIIAQELQRGYKMKVKVIRHSRVAVSKGKPNKENS